MTDQINLKEMSTQELFELMMEDLYDGYSNEVTREVSEALERQVKPQDVLSRGLVAGMDVVGTDFRDGQIFVPEVLLSARAMKAGLLGLRPLLTETDAPRIGKIVIGTVKGDIHDIGKGLVSMMMEGAGFDVIDLGVNNSAEQFIAAVREHQPDFLGMSALLTTTSPYMKIVINALKAEGLRDMLTVLVGGAPLNGAMAEEYGADAYCRDATSTVETTKVLMAARATA